MQLNFRQIMLFLAASAVVWYSGLAGGALLSLAVLMQLGILMQGYTLSRPLQMALFKLFLLIIPTCVLWAGAHSFVFLYLRDANWLPAIMATTLSYTLFLIIYFIAVFSNGYLAANDFAAIKTLNAAFVDLKNQKARFFTSSGLIFVFCFVPFLQEDWKLVFAFTVGLSVLNRQNLQKAFARGP